MGAEIRPLLFLDIKKLFIKIKNMRKLIYDFKIFNIKKLNESRKI